MENKVIQHLLDELKASETAPAEHRRRHLLHLGHEHEQVRGLDASTPLTLVRKAVWMVTLHGVDVPLDADYRPILPILSEELEYDLELTPAALELTPDLDIEPGIEIDFPELRAI